MFCPKCGLQQPDSSNFCQRCGYSLTEKREQMPEIMAGADMRVVQAQHTQQPPSPTYQPQPAVSPAQPVGTMPVQQAPTQASRAQGQQNQQRPVQRQRSTEYDKEVIFQRAQLPHLAARRIICLVTLLLTLAISIISWLNVQDVITRAIELQMAPPLNNRIALATVAIIILGLVQSFIGMGTLYSRGALATAFVMSTVAALLSLLNLPGGWAVRITVFVFYAAAAFIEGVSAGTDAKP